MDSSQDQTGSRLGPYHLDRLYRDIGEPGGQLYAAHHVETGRPALVLVPGPGETWVPRGDWSARVTSQASPPFLATELEHPPETGASAIQAMDRAFIRLAGAGVCLEEHPEANAVLTQWPRPPPVVRSERRLASGAHERTGMLIAGALVLIAGVLWLRLPGSPPWGPGVTEGQSTERVVGMWIDNQKSPSAVGYPMPDSAFPDQMTPPCPGHQVELRGGCWMLLKQRAPCDKETAEYKDECYVPMQKRKPPPTSIKH